MVSHLLFAAFMQSTMVTGVLAWKVSRRNQQSLLFCLFMAAFTLMLFRLNWIVNFKENLLSIHIPMWYAIGPIFYFFIRFSFLPAQKNDYKVLTISLLPSFLEIGTAVGYWFFKLLGSPIADIFKSFASQYAKYSFYYFCFFIIASIVFLVGQNPMIKLNMMYKKQLKWLKLLLFFITLFIISELTTSQEDMFFGSIIFFCFTNVFMLALLSNAKVFSKANQEGEELLKRALNEVGKAVVITNKDRIVEYVNEPFLDMVGYRRRDIVGRKPSFLQGALTTPESVHFVRQKLAEQVPFQADIINYRKNGEAYVCRIAITPVFSEGVLTKFVAYEEDIETIEEASTNKDERLVIQHIKSIFDAENLYKNKQLQLADVAEKLAISPRKLSEILKKHEGQSFTEFVNTYRINAVIEQLQEGESENMTIEAISQTCGFNSKSSFNNAFKNQIGSTPSQFLAQMA
jgi:PAS domain S-box-containing protein